MVAASVRWRLSKLRAHVGIKRLSGVKASQLGGRGWARGVMFDIWLLKDESSDVFSPLKDLAALAFGTSASKTSYGRSNSLGGRGGDSAAAASRAGGSLKRGSLGPQPTRQAPGPSRSALRLCSSRSFSSLSTTSLSVAPFMRSSRSLSRLDQRCARDGNYTHE